VRELTEAQEAFRAEVARFAAEEIAPHATAWDAEDRYPTELFGRLGALGWLGVGYPRRSAGRGADRSSAAF